MTECPRCAAEGRDRSKNNLAVYPDGHEFCYAGHGLIKGQDHLDTNIPYTYEFIPWEGITQETMRRMGVKARIDPEGRPKAVLFPMKNGANQIRAYDRKDFKWEGDASQAGLFFADKFSAGEAQACTITEGAKDALAAFQMLGGRYPVFSIRSAGSARRDCEAEFELLNSFSKIYLALDNDEPGRKAARDIAGLFDFNKIYNVQLTRKDPHEYLAAKEADKFGKIWWNAKRYLPQGIVSSFAEFDKIIDEHEVRYGAEYPFQTLQEKTYGIRKGEFVLLTGLEGIGKTEILRSWEYHLMKKTDAKIGVIHCEEDEDRIIKGFAGMELGIPAHLPDSTVSKAEIKAGFRKAIGPDERLHLYSPFDIDDPDVILDNMRFLTAVCGCEYIGFDNITKMVTGTDVENVTQKLDYLSTKLAAMAKERNFGLLAISHVNDEGLTRGSRNISKVCNIWIHVDRNIKAGTMEERNVSYLTINKNRYAGRTGPAGKLWFDEATFRLEEMKPIEQVEVPVE